MSCSVSHHVINWYSECTTRRVLVNRVCVTCMSARKRIGISTATTDIARRQLMLPVPCWEKVWITPQDVPTGSTLKVYKWVKTDKKQVSYACFVWGSIVTNCSRILVMMKKGQICPLLPCLR